MIRKATEKDVKAIAAIYDAIHAEEDAGHVTIGWETGVYPVEKTASDAVARGDMFVCEEDGRILASGILNRVQVDVYAGAPWKYDAPDDQVMVLHTLVVDPAAGHRGIGRKFIEYYEEYALANGCRYLRIDTNERNVNARAMYKKLGFTEPCIVPCVFNGIEGVNLVLLEKKL